MTSADENYGFKLTLLNSFELLFTIEKSSNRKQFIELLTQLTQYKTPPSPDLAAYRFKQTSEAHPVNHIDFAAKMGLEIAVEEEPLLNEVEAPTRLRELKFPEAVVPAAAFPHILYYLEKEFEKAIFEAENQSNFKLTALNADFKLCESYPLLVPIPKAIAADALRAASLSRADRRFPLLSYTRRDAPCIFRAGIVMNASDADKLLFDSFATVEAAETVICDCRSPEKVNELEYGTVKSPVIYFSFPETEAIQEIYDEFASGVELIEDAVAMTYCEICPKAHDAAFEEEMRVGLLESDEIKNFILEDKQLPPVSIAQVFSRVETRAELVGPPVFLRRLTGSGYLELLIQYIQAAILVTQLFKQNKNVCIEETDSTDSSAVVAALAEMLLQPEFRTAIGLREIIEREFIAAGHKFGIRLGTFEETGGFTAPVFFCFLDCIRCLLVENPDRFAFDEDFLLKFAFNTRSGSFGTFLLNSECERAFSNIELETNNIWDFIGVDQIQRSSDEPESKEERLQDETERIDGVLHFAPEDVWIWKRWFFGEEFIENAMKLCKSQ